MERIIFKQVARQLVANRNAILAVFLAAAVSGCASTPPPYNGLGYSEVQPMQGTGAKVAVVAPKPAQKDRPLYAPTYAPVYGYGEWSLNPGIEIPGWIGGPIGVRSGQSRGGNYYISPYSRRSNIGFSGKHYNN